MRHGGFALTEVQVIVLTPEAASVSERKDGGAKVVLQGGVDAHDRTMCLCSTSRASNRESSAAKQEIKCAKQRSH
jgi:hypothetical protein